MNILKFDLSVIEATNRNVLTNDDNFDLLFDYNEYSKTNIVLEPGSEYQSISFANVTSPFLLIASSDREINFKINGVEYTNCRRLVLNIPIESVEVLNTKTYDTTVKISIYGVQQ